METIRRCKPEENPVILSIINAAAEAYRGVIPVDSWHEPYFSSSQLEGEIAAGVVFWGYESEGALVAIMGLQSVRDVALIRHAYVAPAYQQRGIGGRLLAHLRLLTTRPMLVGTWADAEWAIRFYERNGFDLVAGEEKAALLDKYWTNPQRQNDASVVLRKAASPVEAV